MCTIFLEEGERKELKNLSLSPKKLILEPRLRLNNQKEEEKQPVNDRRGTSSEIRRNRVRSKALGEESEFFIGNREYRDNEIKIKLRKKLSDDEDLQGRFVISLYS